MNAKLFLKTRWACICVAATALTPRGTAQGYVVFNNRIPGQLIAPIFGGEPADPTRSLRGNPTNGLPAGTTVYHGSLLEGSGFTAQLWVGPPSATEVQLQPVATTTFLTGANAGFVQPPPSPVLIPGGVPSSGQVAVQWRVWKNVGGTLPTWSSVLAAGSVPRGVSEVFTVTLGSSPATAAPPSGLRSFNITCLSCGTRPSLGLPTDVNAVIGETVNFSIPAFGELPVTYVWHFNGAPIQSSPFIVQTISEAGFTVLSISNVQPVHAGRYNLSASNDFGVTVSSNAILAVFSPPFLHSPRATPEGEFSLILTGAPNRRYSVETSTNLASWFPHATLTNATGHVSFTDNLSFPSRSFRARVLP